MILGIIPARGGSKRLPGKNLRELGGKPLIAWTIEAAQASTILDRFVVVTESVEIGDVAENCGAEVIERPPHLATDESSVYDTIFHVLDEIPAKWVVLLQPTSPFRTGEDINSAFAACRNHMAPACVSCEYQEPVPNGAVYIAYVSWLREHGNFDGPRTVVYGMPSYRSVDINTQADLDRAKALLEQSTRCILPSTWTPPVSHAINSEPGRDPSPRSCLHRDTRLHSKPVRRPPWPNS